MKIAVLGNCQSRPIAKILSTLCSKVIVLPETVVHLQSPEQFEENYRSFQEADIIFAQFVTDGYQASHLATSRLKSEFGDKVISWPNAFFTGQSPDVISMASDHCPRIIGPLDTYHLSPIYFAWQQSLSVNECLDRLLVDKNIGSTANASSLTSINELKKREEVLDVSIAGYIEEHWKSKNLFHVFNHPTNTLLLELAVRMIEFVNLSVARDALPYYWPEALDRVIVPTLPTIKEKLKLTYRTSTTSKGFALSVDSQSTLRLDSVKILSIAELVESFYYAYDFQLNKDEVMKITPSYLDVRIAA